MNRLRKLSMTGAALLVLSGCIDDASDPDRGSAINRSQVSGVAVDGYIAGARVYADRNNNGRIDAFEPQAITDEYGYFSFRPAFTNSRGEAVPERDYCVEGPERHCLRILATAGEVRIRVQGGYDLATGQPFGGSLSGLVTVQPTDDRNVRALTPLTSASSMPAAGDDDFWGLTPGSELDASAALRAFLKHQSLVAVARDLRDRELVDSDNVSTARLVAAFYDELVPVLDQGDWWGLSESELETTLLDASRRFDTSNGLEEAVSDWAERVKDNNDDVANVKSEVDVASSDQETLTGLTRILLAFLNLQFGNNALDDADALDWAWGQVLSDDDEACGEDGRTPARIIVSRMEQALRDEDEDESGEYCATRGSGTFPTLEGESANLSDGDEEIGLAFGQDGTLELTAKGIDGLDEFADENGEVTLGGFYSQPTDDQLLITLEAFDGSFRETATITFVDSPDEGSGDFVFSFRYLDEETEFNSGGENPFGEPND